MRIAFRVDAAVRIGSGHVARCLNLAVELRDRGADVLFVTRAHVGHLAEQIKADGFRTIVLEPAQPLLDDPRTWLGTTTEQDARDTFEALKRHAPLDWLIVDHYAIDAAWHVRARATARSIMVIDDLADRTFDAEIIVNQNYGADCSAYRGLVAPTAELLSGVSYALIGHSYRRARSRLERTPRLPGGRGIIISLGGTDPTNATGEVLRQIAPLIPECDHVDVVIGRHHPDRDGVAQLCASHPNVELHVQVASMVELLVRADVAIGAGGVSTWERMCLGVPTLTLPLAANQVATAAVLARDELVALAPAGWRTDGLCSALRALLEDGTRRRAFARRGMRLVDGAGAARVADAIERGPRP